MRTLRVQNNLMPSSQSAAPLALTIAGLDPSGGAGVIADVRTFAAFGCSPAAAITSITFQNDRELFGAEHLSADTIRGQVMAIVSRGAVACAKTGMLPTRNIVREVARLFRETNLPAPVVDPVIRSTSGYALIEDDALEDLLEELLPLARLVTPNIPEAERIIERRIDDVEGMRAAAKAIRVLGARSVLIKGGHLWDQEAGGSRQTAGQAEAIDVLDDNGCVTVLRGEWIAGANLRGTGCMLSAAIAACLGKGMTLEDSVSQAKTFVAKAIKLSSTDFSL
jgi:hydroxymethylpyrimidine kinase/phosphomethylpyrimidine kinase